MSASFAAHLAYPEYDLNVPTGNWWMHDADVAGIRAKMAEGYRLHSVDVVQTSPLRFTATFVLNQGVYARTGNGFAEALTKDELLNVYADKARRLVDVAEYLVNGSPRFAAVWLDNTGSQFRDYRLIVDAIEGTVQSEHPAYRIMSLDNGPVLTCPAGSSPCLNFQTQTAVMIPNQGADARQQWFGTGSGSTITKLMMDENGNCHVAGNACKRLATLDQIGTDDSFSYVLEGVFQSAGPNNVAIPAAGEQSWWAGGLRYIPGDLADADSLEHFAARVGGRFGRLQAFSTPQGVRYSATMVGNTEHVPMSGSSNDGNAVLDEVDAIVARQMRRNGVPGLTVAIVQGGRLVHAKGYGSSDLQAGRVTEPTDMFRLASVSKSISKAAIIRLARSGTKLPTGLPGAGKTFSLDTHPWGDILPYDKTSKAWQPNLGDVTVRDLMNHTTGLRFVEDKFCGCTAATPGCDVARDGVISPLDPNQKACNDFEWKMGLQAWADIEAGLQGNAFYHHSQDRGQVIDPVPASYAALNPGRVSLGFYMNANYHMLGVVLESVAGTTFNDYVRRNFLDPLNLNRVRVANPANGGPSSCDAGIGPLPTDLFQAQHYQMPGFFHGTESSIPPIDNYLCPRDRYPASSFTASPVELLRWATSLDGSSAGYRGLDNSGWAEMGSVGHRGYFPTFAWEELQDAPADPANGRPESIKLAFLRNSDSMERVFDLETELWNLMNTRSANLPQRDLFATYLQPPCQPYFHNLPSERFQACFDYWTALGRNPTTLTVSADGTRMSGAFKPSSARRVHHLVPASTYEAITQEELNVGSVPLFVTFTNLGSGDLRATAAWQQVAAPAATYWAMTPTTYETRWHELANQGYLQTDQFLYTDGGLKLAGTWKKLPHDGYASYWGRTKAEFDTIHATQTAQGLRLVHVVVYQDAGQLRYAGIWQRVGGQYELTVDSSSAAYQATADARFGAGWDLHQVHSFDADSYAAIWVKAPAGRPVLSLEDTSVWTVLQGSVAKAPAHSEGEGSLQVSGNGFAELISSPITAAAARDVAGGVPSTVALDILLPTSDSGQPWLGAAQVYLQIPSAGHYHQFVGQVELTGKPVGTWTRLTFTIPQYLQSALSGAATDVQVGIALTRSAALAPVSIDNLRFLP